MLVSVLSTLKFSANGRVHFNVQETSSLPPIGDSCSSHGSQCGEFRDFRGLEMVNFRVNPSIQVRFSLIFLLY